MDGGAPAVKTYEAVDRRRFREEIMPAAEPAILRGLAADWPAVRAGASADGIARYLRQNASAAPFKLLRGPPEIGGRFFYNDDRTGLNYETASGTIPMLVDALLAAAGAEPAPALAAQAIEAEAALPGFTAANRMPILDEAVLPKLWIGNRIVVAAHHDMFSNIAVVVAGRRRFTLFPPDQVGNLHVGPFEFTPAGTPVSLVNFDAPDPATFPLFQHAWASRQVAELGPGDALYIPYMWWHHVRSLDAVSMLANYWWNDAGTPQPGLAPVDALVHAFLTFSGLPEEQRAAWRPMFEHLVFGPADVPGFEGDKAGIRGRLSPRSKEHIRRQLAALMAR